MDSCLFCQIRDGEITSITVYQDEHVFALDDIQPQAPMHVLVIPRQHIATLNDVAADDRELVGHLFLVAGRIAKDRGFAHVGWRTVFNCNRAAGQTVFHLHLHVLGGRPLSWPPG
jgi:histidine triad (HIT) family protein